MYFQEYMNKARDYERELRTVVKDRNKAEDNSEVCTIMSCNFCSF